MLRVPETPPAHAVTRYLIPRQNATDRIVRFRSIAHRPGRLALDAKTTNPGDTIHDVGKASPSRWPSTPATRAREESSAQAKDRFLAHMERDIADIDAPATELLDCAKLERGTPHIHLESVPAEPWLEDVLADAREGGGPVQIRSDAVCCEPRYMARAVVNLLRNAAMHARSTVTVSVRRENDRTVIHASWHGGDPWITESPLGGARVSIAW